MSAGHQFRTSIGGFLLITLEKWIFFGKAYYQDFAYREFVSGEKTW